MEQFVFTTERLGIRRFCPSDSEDFAEILTDPEVCHFEPSGVFPREKALAEAAKLAKDERFFAVVLTENNKLIGKLYFKDMDYYGAYEIGYTFNRSYWGKGYALEAVRGMFGFAFEKMNVRRIIAEADIKNTRSIRLLERAGMRREGVFIQSSAFRKDELGEPVFEDYASYAILKSEFNKEKAV
ncbi:MAG: GNAT family N-acetyltransferase [Oscillospiraceae bacterium]|nr:GNAT family N-acetyltransferase [Oscillospiraceae bacterium]